MLRQYKLRDYDFKLILLVITLSVIGILAVGSAKSDLMIRQLIGVCVGIVIMIIVSFIDYSLILYFYGYLYIINIILLLSVTFFGIVIFFKLLQPENASSPIYSIVSGSMIATKFVQ